MPELSPIDPRSAALLVMDDQVDTLTRFMTPAQSADATACVPVRANAPRFPTPTISRQFSALARKPMVCRVYSAVTTGLGRRRRK
jgi:hypothetical protein